MEKIAEAERGGEEGEEEGGGGGDTGPRLDPKVVEVYTEVGRFLSHYKSGKLPKVFKLIPGLANWEEITFLTNPETWTPHATYAATRIFASSFNPTKAQRFYNIILLPKCRDDIYFNKRLNFHLYLALKKATYKPAAFYKGIILPLAAAPDCTLKEALIFGSVIAKVSIPQLHSAAALIKLAGMRYSGAVSVLMRVSDQRSPRIHTRVLVTAPPLLAPPPPPQIMVNKKYTLPHMAVDALADHFATFLDVDGPLPLVWHQALLAVAQRYKADLTAAQKETLKAVMHRHVHPGITAEVRRELFSVGCRGDPVAMLPQTAVAAPGGGGPTPAMEASAAASGWAGAWGAGGGAGRSGAAAGGQRKKAAVDMEY